MTNEPRWMVALTVAVTMVLTATPAFAYIGPGAGLSALGSVVALFAAVGLAIVGFVWYPVKRLRRRRNGAAAKTADKPAEKAAG